MKTNVCRFHILSLTCFITFFRVNQASYNQGSLSTACFEGLCAASVVMLYPNLRRSSGLQRFSSLGVGGNQGGSGGTGNRSRNGSVNTNSLPTGLDPTVVKQTSKHCLSPDDIVDKYREAIVHYSKVRPYKCAWLFP